MPTHGPSGDPHMLGGMNNDPAKKKGKAGALGLLSEKLAEGIANKRTNQQAQASQGDMSMAQKAMKQRKAMGVKRKPL